MEALAANSARTRRVTHSPGRAPSTRTRTPAQASPTRTRTPAQAPSTRTRTPAQAPSTRTRTPALAPPPRARTPVQAPPPRARTPVQAPPTRTRTPVQAPPTRTRTPAQAPVQSRAYSTRTARASTASTRTQPINRTHRRVDRQATAPPQAPAPPQADTSRKPVKITNNNIHRLVDIYINNPNKLPWNLKGQPIGNWDVSNVTDMSGLFSEKENFNESINDWNVSNVTDMGHMFLGAHHFNKPLNKWKVSNVTDMNFMFAEARSFNKPLNKWNVSNVTDMREMFSDAIKFNQPLDRWDISNVEDMTAMFMGATEFGHYPNWNINPNVPQHNMFRGTRVEHMHVQAPVQNPSGVAFEIHNAFAKVKLVEFMNIINAKVNTANNYIDRMNPLQPLIDNINTNTEISSDDKRDLSDKIHQIFDILENYSGYDENINNITKCIQYILMQPQEVINIYIQTMVTDCLKAYSTDASRVSCVKGVYERIFMSFRDTFFTVCMNRIQNTGDSPICKPEYIDILKCFYTMEKEGYGGLNEYMKEWYGNGIEKTAMTPEERKSDFINFVKNKINNDNYFYLVKESIIDYANNDMGAIFGGNCQ